MQSINQAAAAFLACKRVAVTGVSRMPKAHGSNNVYKRLRERGYQVFAVNPNTDQVEGDRCYRDLASIPGGVEAVVIGTRPEIAEDTMRQCAELGIKQVWMHRGPGPGSVSAAATGYGRQHGITVIDGGCPLMFGATADFGHKIMRHVYAGHVPKAGVNQCAAVSVILRARHQERGEKTMSAYRKLLERYVELYNAGDLNACMELYAEDAVQRMHDGTFAGRSAIRERLARDLTACPDAAYTVGSFVEQGDSFADEWTFAGTHTGPFSLPDGTQLPPTGRRLEIKGMELVQVRDGKIVIDNLYYDAMAVLVQLGVVPQGAPA